MLHIAAANSQLTSPATSSRLNANIKRHGMTSSSSITAAKRVTGNNNPALASESAE
jgi:hypothetical protein